MSTGQKNRIAQEHTTEYTKLLGHLRSRELLTKIDVEGSKMKIQLGSRGGHHFTLIFWGGEIFRNDPLNTEWQDGQGGNMLDTITEYISHSASGVTTSVLNDREELFANIKDCPTIASAELDSDFTSVFWCKAGHRWILASVEPGNPLIRSDGSSNCQTHIETIS